VLGYRQRSLHPLSRRLRDAFRIGRPPRSQRVYVVSIEGRPYKRVVLPDAHLATLIAGRLREFGPEGVYPALILERERELWVEYIEGAPLGSATPEAVDGVARVLSTLHRRAPREVPLAETSLLDDLQVDLRFLADVGVLTPERSEALATRARALAPRCVWLGYECTDAIAKNFVRTPEGSVRAIDVESLGGDQLIGIGAAKACLRWLGPERKRLLAGLRSGGSPDFESYLPFAELVFLAFWTKSSLLEGKRRFVRSESFEQFLHESYGSD
jgi:hypothetical protein